MADFNPICESITVRFICPECGEEVVSDAMDVPSPDFSAEKNSDSMNYEAFETVCEKCGRTFDVTIYNAMYGGDVEVEDVDDVDVEEEYAEVDDDYENYVFDLTPEQITKVLDEIEALSSDTKEFLYRQLYAGAIGSMEAYLSSTLIKEVLSKEENKRRFVEKYLPFREEQIAIANIYEQMDKIDTKIQETLRGLMYHNLAKIKPIYKDTLDIDLGDISRVMRAVQIRHDIVHRSGKDKDGNMHNINKNDVIIVVEIVSAIISRVQTKLMLGFDESDPEETDVKFPWEEDTITVETTEV